MKKKKNLNKGNQILKRSNLKIKLFMKTPKKKQFQFKQLKPLQDISLIYQNTNYYKEQIQ